jgi:hypothetical protein
VGLFKGKILVNIREYYKDVDGVEQPGSKGIALTKQQWEALKEIVSTSKNYCLCIKFILYDN